MAVCPGELFADGDRYSPRRPVPRMQPRSDLCAAVTRYAKILVAQNISPSQRSALLHKIDRLVMRLYGLSRRDFLHLPKA
jgi:hypothetical protein